MRSTSARRRHSGTAVIALLLVAGLAACSADSTDERDAELPSTETVTIQTFIYSPDPLTVPVGTTVVFENLDSTSHTVTAGTRELADTDLFDADLEPGETTEWTFDEPGTYDYFCVLHSGPGMTGQVIVEAD